MFTLGGGGGYLSFNLNFKFHDIPGEKTAPKAASEQCLKQTGLHNALLIMKYNGWGNGVNFPNATLCTKNNHV